MSPDEGSLRSALFGRPDASEARVLARLGGPIKKRTASDLGRPNGNRVGRIRPSRQPGVGAHW